MKIRETFCFILISIIIITCETNDLPCCDNLGNRTFDIKIDFNKYYNEEIFPSEYLSAYDTWHLDYISGGFSGGGYVRDFDQLVIQKYGIFKIIRNDSLLVYGKIDINSQNPDNLFITLEADSVLGKVAFYDMAKYLYVSAVPCFLELRAVTDTTITLQHAMYILIRNITSQNHNLIILMSSSLLYHRMNRLNRYFLQTGITAIFYVRIIMY